MTSLSSTLREEADREAEEKRRAKESRKKQPPVAKPPKAPVFRSFQSQATQFGVRMDFEEMDDNVLESVELTQESLPLTRSLRYLSSEIIGKTILKSNPKNFELNDEPRTA